MPLEADSRHWECSGGLGYSAGYVYSRHVCLIAIAAELRQARGPSWVRVCFERVRKWLPRIAKANG
ncbi:MAG TPA: hypothetical protein VGF16_16745 [Bryobacteraceae bacterium]